MLKTKLIVIQHYVRLSVKWCLFSMLTGAVCGLLGTGLYFFVQWANEIRSSYSWLLLFLPVAGLIIVKHYLAVQRILAVRKRPEGLAAPGIYVKRARRLRVVP